MRRVAVVKRAMRLKPASTRRRNVGRRIPFILVETMLLIVLCASASGEQWTDAIMECNVDVKQQRQSIRSMAFLHKCFLV